MKANITDLADMCGMHRETVRKRLRDLPKAEGNGREVCYDSVEALPRLYRVNGHGGPLDLSEERAKLAKSQTERVSLDVQRLQAELLDTDDVRRAWSDLVERFEHECAVLPAAMAHAAMGATTVREIEESTRKIVDAALTRLSELKEL